MYSVTPRKSLHKKLAKLVKRNLQRYARLMAKLPEILENPQHFKNLRAPLQDWKRVHIDSSFVLAFSVDEENKIVILEDFDHHDKIYRNR